MKRSLILFLCLLSTTILRSQNVQVWNHIKKGTELHDQGKYKEALAEYKNALALDPNSEAANYEISFTHLTMKNYEEAIAYADKVLKMKGKHMVEAVIVKGSAQDDMGQPKEAIKTYQFGIKKLEPYYLIYYNLALTQVRIGENEEALENLEKAIRLRPSHASSHYMVGILMAGQQQRSKAILAFSLFLLSENNTERSEVALAFMEKMMMGNTETKGNNTTIYLDANGMVGDFGAADLFLSLNSALREDENFKEMSEEEFFSYSLTSFLKMVNELRKENKGFFWEIYVDFFGEMENAEVLEPYSYYIQKVKKSIPVDTYIASHPKEMEKFFAFFSEE